MAACVDPLDAMSSTAESDMHEICLLLAIVKRAKGARRDRALTLLCTKVDDVDNAFLILARDDVAEVLQTIATGRDCDTSASTLARLARHVRKLGLPSPHE